MHVGVFLDEFRADLGGGFTFVNDVVESFIPIASESSHRYTLFCSPEVGKQLRLRRLPANLTVVDLAPRGVVGRAISALKHVTPVFGLLWRRPCGLERAALAHGVEMIWFVGGFFDTLDMPYIATVWDLQHLTHPWFPEVSAKWRWEYRELFLQRHLRRAAGVVTGTAVGKRELVSFYGIPADRIHILPHPTPSFALNAPSAENDVESIKKFNLTDEFLLYPAQFWPHKNHINLLLGLKRLGEMGHHIPNLALVGSDKGNRGFVQAKAAELGLENKVHFLGFVSTQELIGLYRQAEALIYPSFSGPENLPPLEAFALGCPVVASDFMGSREQFGDAALLFDPMDPEELAKALLRLKNPMIRAELVERGHTRAESWTGRDYSRGILRAIDGFVPIRRTWA